MNASDRPPKGTRLVRYLKELARLKSKSIPDVNRYEAVLWLGRLPEGNECFSRHRDDPHDDDPDLWLEVRKPQEPQIPPPPAECMPWLTEHGYRDSRKEPFLRQRIPAPTSLNVYSLDDDTPRDSDDPSLSESTCPEHTKSPQDLLLDDYPQVQQSWQNYLDTTWWPWAIEQERWRSIQHAYETLFRIHSAQQTRGEQVELLLGVGLLC